MRFLVILSGSGYGSDWRKPDREYVYGDCLEYGKEVSGDFIEIDSLEALAAFVTEANEEVIIRAPSERRDCWSLEIYNDYRE